MKFIILILTICFSLGGVAKPSQEKRIENVIIMKGQEGGNGGSGNETEVYITEQNVRSVVSKITRFFHNNHDLSFVFQEFEIKDLVNTGVNIEIEILDQELFDKEGISRTCLNFPADNLIQCNLSYNQWNDYPAVQFVLLFHELLGLIGVEENGPEDPSIIEGYQVSKKLAPYVVRTTNYDLQFFQANYQLEVIDRGAACLVWGSGAEYTKYQVTANCARDWRSLEWDNEEDKDYYFFAKTGPDFNGSFNIGNWGWRSEDDVLKMRNEFFERNGYVYFTDLFPYSFADMYINEELKNQVLNDYLVVETSVWGHRNVTGYRKSYYRASNLEHKIILHKVRGNDVLTEILHIADDMKQTRLKEFLSKRPYIKVFGELADLKKFSKTMKVYLIRKQK